MPTFYHYTDDEGAENIIRSGTIQASLNFMSNGDVAYGNGVYLTELNPGTSTEFQIAMNNWKNTNANTMENLKNYFILDIPESEIKDTNATGRNIFLFGHRNDLRLHKYKWVLQDFDSGVTIASYKYKISSSGPAATNWPRSMGDYVMIDETVNGRPVYKGSEDYLFMDSTGHWMVGPDIGKDMAYLRQGVLVSLSGFFTYDLGPDLRPPWRHMSHNRNGAERNDDTLKVTAYGGIVMTFSFDKI